MPLQAHSTLMAAAVEWIDSTSAQGVEGRTAVRLLLTSYSRPPLHCSAGVPAVLPRPETVVFVCRSRSSDESERTLPVADSSRAGSS